MTIDKLKRLIPFLFVFIGSYVASFLFFVLPPLLPSIAFSIVIILVAVPSLYFLYRWMSWKNTLVIILTLCSLVLLIESIGILTGFPYGYFSYTNLLGIKIFGLVPWAVPFAFIPLLLGTVAITIQYVQTLWKIILISTFLLVVTDLIIDPILAFLGVWIWMDPGSYYGVPFSNFGGWFLTSLITTSILLVLLKWRIRSKLQIPLFAAISLVLTVAFWSGYAFWSMLYIPFLLSLFLLAFLMFSFIKFWPIA